MAFIKSGGGKGKEVIFVGDFSYNQSTVDIKEFTSDYPNLTANNFFVKIISNSVHYRVTNYSASSNKTSSTQTSYTVPYVTNYNASTGIVSIGGTTWNENGVGNVSNQAYYSYRLYIIIE